jgi:gephyrin
MSSSSSPSQQPFNVAILIISDTASRDASTDKVIPTLIQTFTDFPGKTWSIRKSKIVPDDLEAIQQVVTKWAEVGEQVDLIVTSGGTGFSQKDVTPEVGPFLFDFLIVGVEFVFGF